jgi:hypothetical protein
MPYPAPFGTSERPAQSAGEGWSCATPFTQNACRRAVVMRALISLAAARSWGGWLEKQDDAWEALN